MIQDIEFRLETHNIAQINRLLLLILLISLLLILNLLDLLITKFFLHFVDRVVGVLHEIQRLFNTLLLIQLPDLREAYVDTL